jgi:competence protein ComEA
MCNGWPNMLKKILLLAITLAACACFAAVEVNQATEAELDGVKGLGPSSTARILKARGNGAFKDWADFMARVKGIKPPTATKLSRAGLTVNAEPYPDAAGSAPAAAAQ